jgi:hypothetical protein
VVVGEDSVSLCDDPAVPLDASYVVVIAEVKVTAEHAMQVPRSPPAERKPINDPRGEHRHPSILASTVAAPIDALMFVKGLPGVAGRPVMGHSGEGGLL